MSTEREKLFESLFEIAENYNIPLTNNPDMHRELPSAGDFCGDVESAVLAAGYRKPRTITTMEELADLDGGTIIRAVKSEHNPHGLCFEKYGKEWLALDPADREDGEVTIPHTAVLKFYGAHSITVLYVPEVTA